LLNTPRVTLPEAVATKVTFMVIEIDRIASQQAQTGVNSRPEILTEFRISLLRGNGTRLLKVGVEPTLRIVITRICPFKNLGWTPEK
jgi:hypothetical protein